MFTNILLYTGARSKYLADKSINLSIYEAEILHEQSRVFWPIFNNS